MEVSIYKLALGQSDTVDDASLKRELKGKAIRHLQSHVVHERGGPHLVLVVSHGDKAAPRPDWRAELPDDASREVYDTIRTWRNDTAVEQRLPAYRVLPNRTLAQLAVLRPRSLRELSDVPGVGEATIERYGVALLELLDAA